jgi:hypothetical protein
VSLLFAWPYIFGVYLRLVHRVRVISYVGHALDMRWMLCRRRTVEYNLTSLGFSNGWFGAYASIVAWILGTWFYLRNVSDTMQRLAVRNCPNEIHIRVSRIQADKPYRSKCL